MFFKSQPTLQFTSDEWEIVEEGYRSPQTFSTIEYRPIPLPSYLGSLRRPLGHNPDPLNADRFTFVIDHEDALVTLIRFEFQEGLSSYDLTFALDNSTNTISLVDEYLEGFKQLDSIFRKYTNASWSVTFPVTLDFDFIQSSYSEPNGAPRKILALRVNGSEVARGNHQLELKSIQIASNGTTDDVAFPPGRTILSSFRHDWLNYDPYACEESDRDQLWTDSEYTAPTNIVISSSLGMDGTFAIGGPLTSQRFLSYAGTILSGSDTGSLDHDLPDITVFSQLWTDVKLRGIRLRSFYAWASIEVLFSIGYNVGGSPNKRSFIVIFETLGDQFTSLFLPQRVLQRLAPSDGDHEQQMYDQLFGDNGEISQT